MRNKLDLSNCDREPIHIPGSVQNWGFLVAVQISTNVVSYVSANILDFLDITAGSILGRDISVLEKKIGGGSNRNPLSSWMELTKRKTEPDVYPVEVGNRLFDLVMYVYDSYVYMEFEVRGAETNTDIHDQIGRYVSSILSAGPLTDILNRASTAVKELIGFDRVMIYKFLEDGHGKVIAESKNENIDSYLDLHYPASDIPLQARELYKSSKIRLIADVGAPTSPLLSLTDRPLDLGQCALRAVSPVHIQYLQNMGVSSSFSVSLICKRELWGLISCHNYSPAVITQKQREAAKLLGQIISSSIEFKEEEEQNTIQRNYKATLDTILENLRFEPMIANAVVSPGASFADIVKASGAYLKFEGNSLKTGKTPTDAQIEEITSWLAANNSEVIFQTNKLSDFIPGAEAYAKEASGILACTISRELKEYVIWFKSEYIQSVTWAGNPEKPVEYDEKGELKISPRKSFQSFSQTVKHTSTRWSVSELNNASRFREELLYIINKKASEIRVLNEKLKEAYEELETFSSTISHDLKTPLTVIKSYAQLLERNKSLDDDGKKFAARINFNIGKMNQLIAEVLEYSRVGRSEISFSPIDMKELLETIRQDLQIAFNRKDLVLEIRGTPSISGDRIMIFQVFLNLMNNAIKYSRLSTPPKVVVEGTEDDNEVRYSIEDNGIGIDPKNFGKVFELFKRVNVSEDFEGTGVGLAIVKRILDKHKALVWIESELNKGSRFNIVFNKR